MAMLARGNEFGRRLCEALGIDPRQTKRVVIDSPCDGLVVATATMIVSNEQADKILGLVVDHPQIVVRKVPG